jgi:hypothetical protein
MLVGLNDERGPKYLSLVFGFRERVAIKARMEKAR